MHYNRDDNKDKDDLGGEKRFAMMIGLLIFLLNPSVIGS